MENKLSAISALRAMLREMEQDVGLHELNSAERDVLLAAHAVTGQPGDAISSDQIRKHEFASNLAQATYHRALRTLLGFGFLEKADGYKSRLYVVRSDLFDR